MFMSQTQEFIRQYIPAIGKSVKLRTWSDYTSRNIHVWAWLRVRALNIEASEPTVTVEVLNGTESTGHVLTVPLETIERPIGWQERYTIHVKPEEVSKVLSWFQRGIVVRASHALENAGTMVFQPLTDGDTPAMPHWQFVENTEHVKAEDCAKVFRVVTVETQDIYDVYLVPDTTCKYCNGSGKRHLQTIADVRQTTLDAILADQDLIERLENYDQETQLFTCHCIRGNFRKLARKDRDKLIKEWSADGWETRYVNYGPHSFWQRTRETIIQDWQ